MEGKEKLLKRLQKLRALANDPTGNINETATAAALLTKLMLEEGIEEGELDVPESAIGGKLLVGARGHEEIDKWKRVLANVLAKNNSLMCVVAHKPGIAMDVLLFGGPDDIAAVQYLWASCVEDITRLCEDFCEWEEGSDESFGGVFISGDGDFWAHIGFCRPAPGPRQKEDFCLGAVVMVEERLKEARAEVFRSATDAGKTKGLARLDNRLAEIDGWLRKAGVNVQTVDQHVSPGHAFHAGMDAGRGIHLGGGAALGQGQPNLTGGRP